MNKLLSIFFLVLALAGCTHYGKRLHVYPGKVCDKCIQPLVMRCTAIDKDGAYKCRCESCGKVYQIKGSAGIK